MILGEHEHSSTIFNLKHIKNFYVKLQSLIRRSMKRPTVAVLLLLSACIGGTLAQCNTHTQTCVANAVSSFLFIIRNNVLRARIEDQAFNFAFIDVRFTNIRITSFTTGAVTARDTGSQIILTLNGIAFRLTADWERRRLFRTRRGTIEATASDSSFTFTYDKSATCPTGAAIRCRDDIKNYNFRISGRLFGVIPRNRAPDAFRRTIASRFCGAVQELLTFLLPLLRSC